MPTRWFAKRRLTRIGDCRTYTISVDRVRVMYDPYMIDASPLPPDDPTAHQFMHCVDNKRGWPFWHDNGDGRTSKTTPGPNTSISTTAAY